jgi:hypothetical protein
MKTLYFESSKRQAIQATTYPLAKKKMQLKTLEF